MIRSVAPAVLLLSCVRPALAQLPFELRGYYLNVGLWSDSTPFSVGGVDNIQRIRFMSGPRLGPLDLEVAYEHAISYSERSGSVGSGLLLEAAVPAGADWLDLSWTVAESDALIWTHRFDRWNLAWSPTSYLRLRVGRQTVSWATTLLLTPADPFIPFDPSDPFREFRAGVDALRAQVFPGPLSEIEVVVRPSDTPAGETLTLAGRGRTVLGGWELSAWAGMLHDHAAGAAAAAGALGATALRTEVSLRDEGGDFVLRGTIGADRRFTAWDRDLYVVLEYQHDELGATDDGKLLAILQSEPFGRGELQVLGRDEVAAEASYQLHPLLSVDALTLWNLRDGSALIAPGASYSLTDEATARLGAFIGLGEDEAVPTSQRLPSEYGVVPTIAYVSASLYF